jgi:hypothetical protein
MARAIALCSLLAATYCQAATISFSQTITLDPSLIMPVAGGYSYNQNFNIPAFQVQSGDVISGTFVFSNGPVRLIDAGNFAAVEAFFTSDVLGVFVTSVSSTTFLGVSGSFGGPIPFIENWVGGGLAAGMTPNSASYSFTFTGFNYTINVLSLTSGGTPVTAPFSFTQFSMQGQSLSIVPEPASTGLVAASLLGMSLFATSLRGQSRLRRCFRSNSSTPKSGRHAARVGGS